MRTAFATVLVVLGCLLAGPAVAAYVLVGEVTDRDSYLAAVTPLADDPEVQSTVTDELTAAVDKNVPDAARQIVNRSVTNFVKSDDFRKSWVELNTQVHPQLLALLRGQRGSLGVEGDALVLDLGVLAKDVKARFVADGVPLASRIPAATGKIQLVSGPTIRQLQPAFDLLETLSVVLPIAAIALIVLGLALSARRGRTLVVTGIGLAVAMLLVVLAEWLARSQIAAKSPQPELVGSFYDSVTSKLTFWLWIIVGIGGVFVIVGVILARARRPDEDSPPAAGFREQSYYRA
jgi:hypothetical protein